MLILLYDYKMCIFYQININNLSKINSMKMKSPVTKLAKDWC